MWVYSDTFSTVITCNFNSRPVLPISVDSSSSFPWPAQALGGSGDANLSSSVPIGPWKLWQQHWRHLLLWYHNRLGERRPWLIMCPPATGVIWNLHLNAVWGSEEDIRVQVSWQVTSLPAGISFISLQKRLLSTVVVCNLVLLLIPRYTHKYMLIFIFLPKKQKLICFRKQENLGAVSLNWGLFTLVYRLEMRKWARRCVSLPALLWPMGSAD